MRILVTGCAGFIGFHLCQRLIADGHEVFGIDNLSDWCGMSDTKRERVGELTGQGLVFNRHDIKDPLGPMDVSAVVHLAAQPGVRHSLDHPMEYIQSNVVGFANVLEFCRNNDVKHLVYASSSSVYGLNDNQPFKTTDKTDRPASLYAATKKSNELMAHAYSHLFGLACTGLRFFTVYGPHGRKDMAPSRFVTAIKAGMPITINGWGDMRRDWTYIDDVIDAIVSAIHRDRTQKHKVYNIASGRTVGLMDFIGLIESNLNRKSMQVFRSMQPGDITSTWADITETEQDLKWSPKVSVEEGVKRYVESLA